jgi:hypothetical protein
LSYSDGIRRLIPDIAPFHREGCALSKLIHRAGLARTSERQKEDTQVLADEEGKTQGFCCH